MHRFSDESFRVRDIQFDYPQIPVKPCALCEQVRDFGGTSGFGWPNALPSIASAGRQCALQTGNMPSAARCDQQHRTSVGVAAMENGAETTVGLDAPEEPADLDFRAQPVVAHLGNPEPAVLSGVALIGPHQHGG